MKLCGVVITFYPNVEESKKNITKYLPFIDHLIIWENTPVKDAVKYRISIPEEYANKVSYMGDGINEGIALPLNKVAAYAIERGFTHLLSMDQDSQWVNFKDFRKTIENDSDGNVAIFAPEIFDTTRMINNFNSETQVITSGSIINLNHYSEIGPFYEKFVIDCVDTEYSFRTRVNHFAIKVINSVRLNQTFGNLRKIPLINVYHAHYSPFRIYHIVRNNIWMWRMYRNTGILPKKFFINQIIYWYIIREPLLILLCGKGKFKSLTSIMKGLWDGIFGYEKPIKG